MKPLARRLAVYIGVFFAVYVMVGLMNANTGRAITGMFVIPPEWVLSAARLVAGSAPFSKPFSYTELGACWGPLGR